MSNGKGTSRCSLIRLQACAGTTLTCAVCIRPLQEALDELIRDFANPDAGDRFFPFARMFDWYEGHSWAAGITPFAAGKNQVKPRQCQCPGGDG